MAWTDPAAHVWTTGEVVTAANLNTYVRLNLQALYDAPFCRAFTSVAVSVPNITVTAVALNSESQDNDSIHSTAVNTARATATTGAGYILAGYLVFAASAGGDQRTAILRLNGVTTLYQHDLRRQAAGGATAVTISGLHRLNATDYVELCGYHDSGAALNVTSAVLAIARVSNAA